MSMHAARAEPPLISARGLVKTFGGSRALDEIDVDVAAGEKLVLIPGRAVRARAR